MIKTLNRLVRFLEGFNHQRIDPDLIQTKENNFTALIQALVSKFRRLGVELEKIRRLVASLNPGESLSSIMRDAIFEVSILYNLIGHWSYSKILLIKTDNGLKSKWLCFVRNWTIIFLKFDQNLMLDKIKSYDSGHG